MQAYRIAVIGDRESVMGFRALGLDVFPAEEDSVRGVFKALLREEQAPYAVIYITEELTVPLREDISALKDALIPAVIPIPSKDGSKGLGMTALTSAVERAVGANIL